MAEARQELDGPAGSVTNRPNAAEDTGSFAKIESIARIEAGGDVEPKVYGLDVNKTDYLAKRDHRRTLRMVIAGIAAVAVVLGFLLVAQPFSFGSPDDEVSHEKTARTEEDAPKDKAKEKEAPIEEAPAEPEPEPEPEPENLLTASHVEELVRNQSFAGQDVSVREDPIRVVFDDGHVLVSHTVGGSGIDPNLLVGRASQRASALANELSDAQMALEEGYAPVADLTWTVVNPNGDCYLAVRYVAGEAPTEGEGIDVLRAASSYALSESLHRVLSTPVDQAKGEAPTTPSGERITTGATFTSS